MSRGARVLLTSVSLSIGLVFVCLDAVGGQLGAALFSVVLAIQLRQLLKLLLAGRGFTLDGVPLPPAMYFVPAPPAGPQGRGATVGLWCLLGLCTLAFLSGHMAVGGPWVDAFSVTPMIVLWSAGFASVWGVGFCMAVLLSEARWQEARTSDPVMTMILMLLAGGVSLWLSVAPADSVYRRGYVSGWGARTHGCETKRDVESGVLALQFAAPNARFTFSRGFAAPVPAKFEAITIRTSDSSELNRFEFGLAPGRPEGDREVQYVPLDGLKVVRAAGVASLSIPRSWFSKDLPSVSEMHFRAGPGVTRAQISLVELTISR